MRAPDPASRTGPAEGLLSQRTRRLWFKASEAASVGGLVIYSPDLPGFSLMLRPEDYKSLSVLSAAIEGPLVSFITAEEANTVPAHPWSSWWSALLSRNYRPN